MKNNLKVVKFALVGASIAAVAASAYFFFGPKGKKHQQYARAWAIKMKGEIIEKLEMARQITKPIYEKIIDTVAKEYEKEKKAKQKEIVALANDLKKHWVAMSKSAKAAKRGRK